MTLSFVRERQRGPVLVGSQRSRTISSVCHTKAVMFNISSRELLKDCGWGGGHPWRQHTPLTSDGLWAQSHLHVPVGGTGCTRAKGILRGK